MRDFRSYFLDEDDWSHCLFCGVGIVGQFSGYVLISFAGGLVAERSLFVLEVCEMDLCFFGSKDGGERD